MGCGDGDDGDNGDDGDLLKPVALQFEYTGLLCAPNGNSQGGKAKCQDFDALDGNGPVQIVITKEQNSVSVTPTGPSLFKFGTATFEATGDKLKSHLKFDILQGVDTLQRLEIHTSCSVPLKVNDQFGSMKLVGFFPGESNPATSANQSDYYDLTIGQSSTDDSGSVPPDPELDLCAVCDTLILSGNPSNPTVSECIDYVEDFCPGFN